MPPKKGSKKKKEHKPKKAPAKHKKQSKKKKQCPGDALLAKTIMNRKKAPPARNYEPDLPSDARHTLAEKLLLGEELAQYSFGSVGSFCAGFPS